MVTEEVRAPERRPSLWTEMRTSEDWWSIWCAGLLLLGSFMAVWFNRPADFSEKASAAEIAAGSSAATEKDKKAAWANVKAPSPLKPWVAQPAVWTQSPLHAFENAGAKGAAPTNLLPGIVGSFVIIGVLFALAAVGRGRSIGGFLVAFPSVFLLALVAYVMAGQSLVDSYNLEYVLWALVVGLVISNVIGTPAFLQPAILTEFYIKTGLILLGAEVLMNRLLALGPPGVFVSWVVTPITLISTYVFGQRVLKIPSRSLNMVISADMSVCGVSAAIATGAACKAKKEELSLAIGLSLVFTVFMMAVMPAFIKAVGMDEVLGGAWIGGTIDSTGAVAAAGAALGDRGLEVAATVKMIQNILIGAIAFGVAVYWVTSVERDPTAPRPSLMEIWYRFPKFVLGFVLASIVFSSLTRLLDGGSVLVDSMIAGSTKTLRGWLFCLAFVSIGLETKFKEFGPFLRGGKPLILYVCGQALNLLLTFVMAWLMFRVVFRDMVDNIAP